jgi:hyaluronan synthase
MTPWWYYVLGTPLGVLGLVRWSFWLVRRVPAVLYTPYGGHFRAPLSVVVPVYQEDPEVFTTALHSWLANGVQRVILVVDVTDAACLDIAYRYAAAHPVTVIVTDVPGKRDALRRGWNAATTELVALVDSDTIWAPDVAVEVCKPFADPRIGGVGTRQNVYRGKGLLSRVTEMFLDHRYFDENACQTYMGRAVSCLSGRTAVYRRAALLRIEYDFMTETFCGVPCLSGDDKRLTTLLLQLGYQTYLQRTAQVWSTFPTRWRKFVAQRLRWARNTWRSDLRALSSRWVWRHPFLAYTMADKAISCFTLLAGPTFMVYALIHQRWAFAAVLALWWQVSRSAKLLPHLRRHPSSLLIIPGYVVLSWVMALIKIWALLTVRTHGWLTRDVAVRGGAVVRTGAPVGYPAPVPYPYPAPVPAAQPGRPWFPGAAAVLAVLLVGGLLAAPAAGTGTPEPVEAPVVTVAEDEPLADDADAPEPPADADAEPDGAALRRAERQAARARTKAEHRAQLAAIRQRHLEAAAASVDAIWQRRGRPAQLVIVRARNVDQVGGGRLVRRIPRPPGPELGLPDLARLLPPDWLVVDADGTATLSATLVVGAGTTLDIGVRRLRLAGSADPAKAATIWVGRGRVAVHNVNVGSFDRDRPGDQPAPTTAAGRPSFVAGAGATLDIADSTVHDLGTSPLAGGPSAHAAVVFGPGSTGSVSRTQLLSNSVGVKLSASRDVRLDTVTVLGSLHDGLLLRSDVNTALRGVRSEKNGRNGVLVTGATPDRTLSGVATSANALFGFAVVGQQRPTLADLSSSGDRAGGIRLTSTNGAVVSNATVDAAPTGILVNGVRSIGTQVRAGRISGGRDGIAIARGTSAVTLENVTVTDAARDGITTAGTGTTITGGSVSDSRTGLSVRAPARMTGTRITGVAHGVHVGPGATLSADVVDVLATGSGVKADPTSTASVTGSRIRARQSLRGAVTLVGANTISPAPFNWIGAFGVLFVLLALWLETVDRRRRVSPPPFAPPPYGPPPGYVHPAATGHLPPVGSTR